MALLGLLFYFLPTTLAALRRRKGFRWILALNVLLGWTVIGWIVALIWAIAGKPAVNAKPRSKAVSFALGALVALGVISFPVILANAPKVPEKHQNLTTASSTAMPSQAPVSASLTSPSSPAQVATPEAQSSLVAVAAPTSANSVPTARTPQPATPIAPEKQPTPENQRAIGEEFTLGDYTYRITGYSVTSRVGSGYSQDTAEAGAKFVLVNFTIRNDSNKTQQVLADDFKIKDQQDRVFSNDSKATTALVMSGGKKDVFLREIQPGLTSKGVTVFRVPADVVQQPMLLQVPQKGTFFGGKTVTVPLVK